MGFYLFVKFLKKNYFILYFLLSNQENHFPGTFLESSKWSLIIFFLLGCLRLLTYLFSSPRIGGVSSSLQLVGLIKDKEIERNGE